MSRAVPLPSSSDPVALAAVPHRIERLQKQAAARPGVIQLGGGLPAPELMPVDDLASAFARALRAPETALQYGWAEGLPELRCWVAARLRRRGAVIDEASVVITSGAQQALALAASELLSTGHRIHVGDVTYPSALTLFRLRGAEPVDSMRDADSLYLMPAIANPRGNDGVADPGAVLSLGRTLIVDEAYTELRFDGRVPAPLLAAARDRTWHVGTISKTICPGLRVGWLIPPRPRHTAVLEGKQATDLQSASLSQAMLARYLEASDYDAHLATLRMAYAARADAMLAALQRHAPSWHFSVPEGGFSTFVMPDPESPPLPASAEARFLAAAIDAGVSFDPGCLFQPALARLSFRLSYSYADIDSIDEGIRRLSQVWANWRG